MCLSIAIYIFFLTLPDFFFGLNRGLCCIFFYLFISIKIFVFIFIFFAIVYRRCLLLFVGAVISCVIIFYLILFAQVECCFRMCSCCYCICCFFILIFGVIFSFIYCYFPLFIISILFFCFFKTYSISDVAFSIVVSVTGKKVC